MNNFIENLLLVVATVGIVIALKTVQLPVSIIIGAIIGIAGLLLYLFAAKLLGDKYSRIAEAGITAVSLVLLVFGLTNVMSFYMSYAWIYGVIGIALVTWRKY